ncbi:SWIM zinc finger family protein [Streptomyces sp. NPDC060194]|uniref:SWIM zinc finger family protein n=1 Tax=Streptomyces sp. NPDC060194 TaxID=3347069 RepID=UPI0036530897
MRRTYPALPPPPARSGPIAETWWGNAWTEALERMSLDAGRLARGRDYARAGHVDAITVTPGRVTAYVHGSRARPYRTDLRLRTLADADWEQFLDQAAARPGHIAALLDKDMPHSLVDSAAEAGVDLLPAPGDLVPTCSCPDSGRPCKHAAALCYQTARLLDTDPFVLLLMRGRGERTLLDDLGRRNAAQAAQEAHDAREAARRDRSGGGSGTDPAPPDAAAVELPALPAAEAVAATAAGLPPLPEPFPSPDRPGPPPSYPAAAGAPDPLVLDQLATDAAARAHALLTTGADPVAGLTPWQDAVRLAAARPGSGLTAATRALYRDLAAGTGRPVTELARAVAAWRQGGADGLLVLETAWDPPAGPFDRARPALLAADLPALRPHRNRLTSADGSIQLRLGRDGRWYPYESDPGREDWWPRGESDADPVGALTTLFGG